MSDKQYNPVECEHKHENGFSAWSFQSEEQSNLGGANKVSVHVCVLCGEINIGGYRPSKDEKHVNSFHETFNIYHPDAIDAIIKQANFYNEKEIWGRIQPSESPKGHVWIKANDHFPIRKKVIAKMHIGYLNKDVVGYASSSTGEMITFDWEISTVTLRIGHPELDGLLWLDETTPTAHPNPIDPQEVWDEYSEYVDDDIDSLSRYAGRDVMLFDSFKKAAEKLSAVHPNKEDAAREQKGVRDSKWLIGRSEERFKELEHYGWHWTSFYNGWLEGRMDMVGEDAAGSQKQYPWGPDEYPDLSACTPEQKHETIFGLIQLAAKEIMRMFYAFGLKTHIECKVVNEPTNETFEFSFVKVDAAAGSGKEEAVACAFLEWAYANRWFNKDGDLWCHTFEMGTSISDKSYRENYMKTTSELYQIYKSQNK